MDRIYASSLILNQDYDSQIQINVLSLCLCGLVRENRILWNISHGDTKMNKIGRNDGLLKIILLQVSIYSAIFLVYQK